MKTFKQIIFGTIVFALFPIIVFAQSNYVTWNFNTSISSANYATNMTNQTNARTTDLTNVTLSTISLNSLTGATANTLHRSSNNGTTFSASKYLEFSVTLTNGNTYPDLAFTLKTTHAVSSATGNYRINYQWGTGGFSQAGSDITGITSTTLSALQSFTISAPGNTTSTLLTIRIHTWHSSATANMRFGDIQLLGDAPLPVNLQSFNSNVLSNCVKLQWKTVEEINNAGFEVQRSVISNQLSGYSKIGFVEGKGTKNSATEYTFEDKNLQSGKYKYRLKQIDYNGNYEYFELSGEVEVGVPKKYDMSQNYPNPFNPVTKINFDLPENGLVNIRLYDMLGREVAILVNEVRNAGYHTVQFDASKLSSGVYFYKMNAGKFNGIKKMAVVK